MNSLHKKKDFLYLLSGVTVSTFGSALYSIAIGIWVLQETGSEALMGLVASISYVISFFVEPIAGAVADFMDSRNMLITADIIQGVTMLLIAFLANQNLLSVTTVIILSVAAAFCNAIFVPASSVLFLRIVSKESYINSQSQISAARSIAKLVAEAISATLVMFLGVSALIFFNGVSFLLSALSECFILKKAKQKSDEEQSHTTPKQAVVHIVKDLKIGFVYLVTQKEVFRVILLLFEMNILTAGFTGVLYAWILAKDFTLLQLSIFLGVQSSVGLVGALILSAVKLNDNTRNKTLKISILVDFCAYLFAMLSNTFVLVIIFISISSFTNIVINMMINFKLAEVIATEHRGKTMGTLNALVVFGTGVSMLLYGLFSEIFNVEIVCIIGAILMIIPSYKFWKLQNK